MRQQPNKDKVLTRFVHQLGPQLSAAHLLSHLGDKEVFTPFAVGDEPKWAEVVAYLLVANTHITVGEVIDSLEGKEQAR